MVLVTHQPVLILLGKGIQLQILWRGFFSNRARVPLALGLHALLDAFLALRVELDHYVIVLVLLDHFLLLLGTLDVIEKVLHVVAIETADKHSVAIGRLGVGPLDLSGRSLLHMHK